MTTNKTALTRDALFSILGEDEFQRRVKDLAFKTVRKYRPSKDAEQAHDLISYQYIFVDSIAPYWTEHHSGKSDDELRAIMYRGLYWGFRNYLYVHHKETSSLTSTNSQGDEFERTDFIDPIYGEKAEKFLYDVPEAEHKRIAQICKHKRKKWGQRPLSHAEFTRLKEAWMRVMEKRKQYASQY